MKSDKAGETRHEAAPWAMLVVTCGKCARKGRGPDGLRRDLKSELKALTGLKRVKVVEAGCLGVCPKDGIALASAAGLARGEVLVLGRDGSAREAAAALLREGVSPSR